MELMDAGENRQIARDSLFVLADLRLDGLPQEHRIKVRNLSEGGMMGEGAVRVNRGSPVEVSIRNIGWVQGTVAWVQDTRFGVAFNDPIDPRLARLRPASDEDTAPHFTRAPQTSSPGTVRKV
jgi:microcystin degradation protein MlrC